MCAVLSYLLFHRKGFFNFAQATLPLLLESVDSSPHPPLSHYNWSYCFPSRVSDHVFVCKREICSPATGQSLAREFGPKGIHVAHVIVDGVIDIPRTKEWPVNGGAPDGKNSSDAVSSPQSLEDLRDGERRIEDC